MIKQSDINEFNSIMAELSALLERVHEYNPQAKVHLYACCDENENDDCGLFLLDESGLGKDCDFLDGGVFSDWLAKGLVGGSKIVGAELYSRSEVSKAVDSL